MISVQKTAAAAAAAAAEDGASDVIDAHLGHLHLRCISQASATKFMFYHYQLHCVLEYIVLL